MAETVAGGRPAPLADDLSIDELAARPKQPAPPRKTASTEKYDKTAKKWWGAFVKHAGWDGTVRINFLNDDGSPRDGTFRQLFVWLYEQDGMTKGIFRTVERLWLEYTTGLDGGYAVCELIEKYGKKWRPPGNASRQLWRWHSFVYEEIERRIAAGASDAEAVAAVQERLDALKKPERPGKRGRACAAANWKGLVSELQREHPRSKKREREEEGEAEE